MASHLPENFGVILMHQLSERREAFLDGEIGRSGILVTAQIRDGPSDISNEAIGSVGVQQVQEGLQNAAVDHRVAQLSTVTSDIAQRPNGLLAHIRVFRSLNVRSEGRGGSKKISIG